MKEVDDQGRIVLKDPNINEVYEATREAGVTDLRPQVFEALARQPDARIYFHKNPLGFQVLPGGTWHLLSDLGQGEAPHPLDELSTGK